MHIAIVPCLPSPGEKWVPKQAASSSLSPDLPPSLPEAFPMLAALSLLYLALMDSAKPGHLMAPCQLTADLPPCRPSQPLSSEPVLLQSCFQEVSCDTCWVALPCKATDSLQPSPRLNCPLPALSRTKARHTYRRWSIKWFRFIFQLQADIANLLD